MVEGGGGLGADIVEETSKKVPKSCHCILCVCVCGGACLEVLFPF